SGRIAPAPAGASFLNLPNIRPDPYLEVSRCLRTGTGLHMDEGVRDVRSFSHPDDEHPPTEEPRGPGLTAADLDATRELAEFHRLLAADLAARSQLRGLVLLCAGHWSRLGAIPRNGLAEVERRN